MFDSLLERYCWLQIRGYSLEWLAFLWLWLCVLVGLDLGSLPVCMISALNIADATGRPAEGSCELGVLLWGRELANLRLHGVQSARVVPG